MDEAKVGPQQEETEEMLSMRSDMRLWQRDEASGGVIWASNIIVWRWNKEKSSRSLFLSVIWQGGVCTEELPWGPTWPQHRLFQQNTTSKDDLYSSYITYLYTHRISSVCLTRLILINILFFFLSISVSEPRHENHSSHSWDVDASSPFGPTLTSAHVA